MNFSQLPPLSLYVHLPWCERKCPYCDFNSFQAETFDEFDYVSALIDDLQLDLPQVWGRQIHSIFIGGGTPSLFSGAAIERLLSDLRACLNLNPGIEITLEANPGSAEAARFRAYREAGVNRLSLGIQSFNDDMLRALGRVHDSAQAKAAIDMARRAGFDNINIDLMYGLPGQDLPQAIEDIKQAIAFSPEHISHYQLGIEPNTLFDSQTPNTLPDDDQTWSMQTRCQQALSDAGYGHYEISAYARQGKRCQHNLNYWQFGDYLGIGAGAHGKISLADSNRVLRTRRKRQPREWLDLRGRSEVRVENALAESDLVFEFMLNALRLTGGFDKTLFQTHCGLPYSYLQNGVHQAVTRELMIETPGQLRPSALGLRFHNDLQAIFLDCPVPAEGQITPQIQF